MSDKPLVFTLAVLVALLALGTVAGRLLYAFARGEKARATLENANERINAWWVMLLAVGAALLMGKGAVLALFALVSFLCLREFLAVSPVHAADRPALFFAFFVLVPVQYLFIRLDWYGMYAIFIPVYGFLLLPAFSVVSGSTESFLTRCARNQWAVMVTIFCLSHAPALVMLSPVAIPGYDARMLLLYLLVVVQLSDVFQYIFGKLFGRRKLAPKVSPSKTVEGLVYGGAAAIASGGLLSGMTPFELPAALALSAVIVAGGALGGLVLSAVKRDMGVKDWGNSIAGHGGFMDRMDSVCFSAPLFFHLTRYFYT